MKRILAGFALIAALGISHSASAQNLIVNGDFATGDFSGWTLGGDSGEMTVDQNAAGLSGPFNADFTTPTNDTAATLSQTFATVAGKSYTLSFDLAGDGSSPSQFSSAINGTTDFITTNLPSTLPSYQTETVAFTATGTSSTLTLSGIDAPGDIYATHVSVVGAASAPEPSALALAGVGGIATLGGIRVRRRRPRA